MNHPPDKFLIVLSVRKWRHDLAWKHVGYIVVDGLHSPFKWDTKFRSRGCRSFPLYDSVVCNFRPLKATSEYFNFLNPL